MNIFSTVAVVGRSPREKIAETLKTLLQYLQKQKVKVILEKETALLIDYQDKNVTLIARENLKNNCELIIVVGGDGSMLRIADTAAKYNLPVLGVNRGNLGFLADINPNNLEEIGKVLSGKYQLENRFLLATGIIKNKSEDILALNDIVISSGYAGKMVNFDIAIDDECMCSYRADGLIFATPTGSTAYALSAGGSILYPSLNAIILAPMFSHNLSSRPIVLNGDSKITIKINAKNPRDLFLNCDGKTNIKVEPTDIITINKATQTLKLIHPLDYNYFATLRSKLGWES